MATDPKSDNGKHGQKSQIQNALCTVYKAFMEKAVLWLPHREELRKKRGFTDETIERFRFVSGGDEDLLHGLRGKFATDLLVRSGVFVEVNGKAQPSPQLTERRIIIPYTDEHERITLLRPHKLGLEGVPIQVYDRWLLRDKPEHIVLTEGEFKAVALWQWGIPAIALPGISSFYGKHFDALLDLVRQFEIKHITVIFDNEDKSSPECSNYKERPEDRWDTPYYAYMMAYKLYKEAEIQTDIGELPDDWRIDGKVDFDGALAAGKTRGEIEAVIAAAKRPPAYLDSLGEEAQRIVKRKVAWAFRRSPVRRDHNRYLITVNNGQDQFEKPVSNFIMDIKATYYGPEGCVRHAQFVNQYGERSGLVELHPDQMAGLVEFKKFCFRNGGYVFEGSGSDLTEVWKYELLRDTGQLIYLPEQIGEIRPNFWLFGNVAIKDGRVYKPDSSGIFWIDDIGYKPQSLNVGPKGETIEDAIPSVHTGRVDIARIADLLKRSVGGYEAYLGLGWVVATIFSRPIFERFKAFPFLFPHGKRESGKSTFVRWLMHFFGIETEGLALSDCTQVFICRVLAYHSSLGVWFDEYRNENKITQKDGYLRSAYNRQLSGKGIKEAFGARSYRVTGTIAISGEEMPQDNGLFTRCCFAQMSDKRREHGLFDNINRQALRFSGFVFELLKRYKEIEPKIIESINGLREALAAEEITDRTALNWAILAGSFDAVIGELLDDQERADFITWVNSVCQAVKASAESEHMLSVFWSDVVVLESERELGLAHFGTTPEGYLAVWFPAVYSKWAEAYRRRTGRDPFDRLSILKYLQDEPYYIGNKAVRLHGAVRKCVVVDPQEKVSGDLKELAEQIRGHEQYERRNG